MTTNYKLQKWEFYTSNKEGIETIVATKILKYPKKSRVYKTLQKQGFINGIECYGLRVV